MGFGVGVSSSLSVLTIAAMCHQSLPSGSTDIPTEFCTPLNLMWNVKMSRTMKNLLLSLEAD